MPLYEKIKTLCNGKGVTITQAEKEMGFARGSLSKIDAHKPSAKRIETLAEYFDVSVNYFLNNPVSENYYFNEETAQMAQQIFDNRELRVLFDAARDARPDDLKTAYDVLLALKRKEGYSGDDPA